jgi:hypothetical protein
MGGMLLRRRRSLTAPSIQAISPSTGKQGDAVTITGTGFHDTTDIPVKDSGFEGNGLSQWTVASGAQFVSVTTDHPRVNGFQCLRMGGTGSSINKTNQPEEQWNVVPGEKWRMKAWFWNESYTGAGGLRLQRYTSGAWTDMASTEAQTLGAAWTQQSTAITTVPASTTQIQARIAWAGSGNICVDDVELERVSSMPTVLFGGVAATNVVVVSDSQITCTVPAHADGAVNVTVTNTWGTSNNYTFTFSSGPVGTAIYDHFATDTRANYSIQDGVLEVASSKLQVPASGPVAGTRRIRYAAKQMQTDDMMVRFTTGSVLNTSTFSSVILRSNGDAGQTPNTSDRWVGVHFISGNMYLARVSDTTYTSGQADFTNAGSLSATQLPVGGIVEIYAVGNVFYVVAGTAINGTRIQKIAYTDSTNNASKGAGFRSVGARIERVSSTNSPSIDIFEAYDLSVWPGDMGWYKSGTQSIPVTTWTTVTGLVVLPGYPLAQLDSANGTLTARAPGTVQFDGRMQRSSTITGTGLIRILKNDTEVVYTYPTATAGAITFTTPDITVDTGDTFEMQVYHSNASQTTTAGSSTSLTTGTNLRMRVTAPASSAT